MPSSVRRRRSQTRVSCAWADLVQWPLHCVCTLEQFWSPWRVAVSHIRQVLQTPPQESSKKWMYGDLSQNSWPNIWQTFQIFRCKYFMTDPTEQWRNNESLLSRVCSGQPSWFHYTFPTWSLLFMCNRLPRTWWLTSAPLIICLDYLLCVMKDWIICFDLNSSREQSIR